MEEGGAQDGTETFRLVAMYSGLAKTRHTRELAKYSEYPCRAKSTNPQTSSDLRLPGLAGLSAPDDACKVQPSPQACAAPEDAIPDLHDVRRSFSAVGAFAERRRTTSQTDASALLQRPNVNAKGCMVMLVVGCLNDVKERRALRPV